MRTISELTEVYFSFLTTVVSGNTLAENTIHDMKSAHSTEGEIGESFILCSVLQNFITT